MLSLVTQQIKLFAGRVPSCWYRGRLHWALVKTHTSSQQIPGEKKEIIIKLLSYIWLPYWLLSLSHTHTHIYGTRGCWIRKKICTWCMMKMRFWWEPSSSSLCISCLRNPHLSSLSLKGDKIPADTEQQSQKWLKHDLDFTPVKVRCWDFPSGSLSRVLIKLVRVSRAKKCWKPFHGSNGRPCDFSLTHPHDRIT